MSGENDRNAIGGYRVVHVLGRGGIMFENIVSRQRRSDS